MKESCILSNFYFHNPIFEKNLYTFVLLYHYYNILQS